jgi:predicted NAD/FAD-dependent oxidoreductase
LHPRGLIIELSSTLSEKLFDEDEKNIERALLDIYERSPLKSSLVKSLQVKKWRYSRPMNQFHAAYIEVAPSLYLSGDSFASPCVSAHTLAKDLLVNR